MSAIHKVNQTCVDPPRGLTNHAIRMLSR
jgi:hypothetical protein